MRKLLAAGLVGSVVALTSCGGGSDSGFGGGTPSLGSGGGSAGGGSLPSSITLTEYKVSSQQWQVGSTIKLSWKVSPADTFTYTLEVFESPTPNIPTGLSGLYRILSVNCGTGIAGINNCAASGTATCEVTSIGGYPTAICYPDVQNPYRHNKNLVTQGNGFLIFRVCATSSNFSTVCDTKSVPVTFPVQTTVTSQSVNQEIQQEQTQ